LLLKIEDMHVRYGGATALTAVSVAMDKGEAICIIGPNGAGKSTLLRAISGLVKPSNGTIFFDNSVLTGRGAREIARMGIAHVPEGRRILPALTVKDNLVLGAYTRRDRDVPDDIEKMFGYFPILKNRQRQAGGTLSGGEQQMLAIARALMMRPRLLLLDEPSLGIAPKIVAQIFQTLKHIVATEKVSVVLVEQNARMAFSLVQRGYVLTQGRVVMSGTVAELERDPEVAATYMGMSKSYN
jgi:branched-chain amino acid transport system ATP-binding protein